MNRSLKELGVATLAVVALFVGCVGMSTGAAAEGGEGATTGVAVGEYVLRLLWGLYG
ncbi:hypothetical protein [Streptomyces sp. NPDC059063]|uniref:hypothetical protein n=1 Tax=unclassified Streptomyces TaxID=2593676 RepID=UPI0036A4B6C8